MNDGLQALSSSDFGVELLSGERSDDEREWRGPQLAQ